MRRNEEGMCRNDTAAERRWVREIMDMEEEVEKRREDCVGTECWLHLEPALNVLLYCSI